MDSYDVSTLINLLCSLVLIWFFIFGTYKVHRKAYWNRETKTGVIGMLCFMLSALVSLFGVTDLFGAISIGSWCKSIFICSIFFSNMGKVSLYWLFSFRIERIIKKQGNETVRNLTLLKLRIIGWIWLYRISFFVLIQGLWFVILVSLYTDIKPNDTKHHCYPSKQAARWLEIPTSVVEVIFGIITLITYCWIPSQISNQLGINNDQDDYHDDYLVQFLAQKYKMSWKQDLFRIMWIVIVELISTILFRVARHVIPYTESYQIGYFIHIEGIVGSFCIYWFHFIDCSCACGSQKELDEN